MTKEEVEDMSAECEAKTEQARADAKARADKAKARGAVNWPRKPQLPSLILVTAYNNGPLVELGTVAAREKMLLDYADEVKNTAYALVDAARALFEDDKEKAEKIAEERGRALGRLEVADAPPPSEPYPGGATGVGDVVNYTSPTTTGYNGQSATMQVMAVEDVAERERAARQRGLGFALSVLGRRAKECERNLGLSEVEVALRRAWEEINEEWREAQNP